jgi:multicomponent K+:H+ antiporter subunit G
MTASDMSLWIAIPASLLLVAGGLVALVGSFGLLRLKDFYSRIHAPTVANTLGAACVLAASMLVASYGSGRLVLHECLIIVLLVLTSPITAMLLMRAARYRDGQAGRPPEQP